MALRSLLSLVLLLFLAAVGKAQTPPPSLRVATRTIAPFVLEDEAGKLNGFSIELWEQISKKLSLTSTYQVTPDVGKLLAAVEKGDAQVGIAAVSITAERAQHFDFSQPMFESGLQILVRANKQSESKNPVRGLLNLLFSPTMLVWLGIAAVLILIPAHLVWFLERNHSEGIIPTRKYIPGIFHAAWWAAGTLATQADSMPRHGLARVLAVFWMFTGVVFVAYFTAQVTTSMTVEQLRGDINGPLDLPGKRVATTKKSTAAAYLKEHHTRVREVSKIEEAFELLRAEQVDAVVFDAPVLLYYATHEGKDATEVVGPIFRKENYGIVFPMGSPYRKPVEKALLSLREDGTYDRLYEKWFGGK